MYSDSVARCRIMRGVHVVLTTAYIVCSLIFLADGQASEQSQWNHVNHQYTDTYTNDGGDNNANVLIRQLSDKLDKLTDLMLTAINKSKSSKTPLFPNDRLSSVQFQNARKRDSGELWVWMPTQGYVKLKNPKAQGALNMINGQRGGKMLRYGRRR